MTKYEIIAQMQESAAYMFGPVRPAGSGYTSGLTIVPNPFQCCGISTLRGFGFLYFYDDNGRPDFAREAEFLAGLWRYNRGRTHYVYVLNSNQVQNSGEHKALMKCGSVQVCQFPNLQPGHQNDLYMFVCNLNEGIGKFFDRHGVAFTEQPVEAAPAVASTVKVKAKPSNKTAETV